MYGGFTHGGTQYGNATYGAPAQAYGAQTSANTTTAASTYQAAAAAAAAAAGYQAAAAGYQAANAASGYQQQQTTNAATAAGYPTANPYFASQSPYATAYHQTAAAAAVSNMTNNSFTSRVDSFVTPGMTKVSYGSPIAMAGRVNTTSASISTSNAMNTPSYTSSSLNSGTSTYTGYDAAVYAAATNYLQSKVAGSSGGSQWLGLRKSNAGGARGSFPHKRGSYSSGGVTQQQQQLQYCDVCKISCAGPQTYREHLEGQRHKKKEAILKGSAQQPLAKSKVSFRCDLCQVTCTGQDTYNAHIRGSKHQKTLKLHHTLGKPIPTSEPTLIAPTQPSSGTITTAVSTTTKKIIGVQQMNFIGGQRLTTTSTGHIVEVPSAAPTIYPNATDAVQAALAAEQHVQPVGEDYVEPIKDHTGKLVQYFCKLCDCKFNDLNAKDMHLKGRRHRLQFKKKVNPSLEVEMKPYPMSNSRRRLNDEHQRNMMMRYRPGDNWSNMRPMYPAGPPMPLFANMTPKPMFFDNRTGLPRIDNGSDDRHVMAKHVDIYPSEEQMIRVQKLVINTEKALKAISDSYAEKDETAAIQETNEEASKNLDSGENVPKERLLKGVMRVGLLAKGLLLRGDTSVSLVVLCSTTPTKKLLGDIADMLPKHLIENADDETYTVSLKPERSSLIVTTTTEPIMECVVTLTSVLIREIIAAGGDLCKLPSDTLHIEQCLDALAQLRHAKWFQARCANLQSCLITLRIMRDICQRIPAWSPLSIWACELLVEKVLTSCGIPLGPGDALRRVFEAVAAGILLPNGPGLLDPCEKDPTDAMNDLTAQQREDITSSAQHALRLIAFNQLYKILAIDRQPDRRTEQRKRPRNDENGSVDDDIGKKDKKDSEDMTTK